MSIADEARKNVEARKVTMASKVVKRLKDIDHDLFTISTISNVEDRASQLTMIKKQMEGSIKEINGLLWDAMKEHSNG